MYYLHWLPIRQRVEFKTCVLMYNCLHNISPSYLSSMCQPVSVNPSRWCLWSAARSDLVVPATKTVCYTALVASPSQDQLRGTRCRRHSAMTNCLSLHFAIYSRLNFFTRAYDSSLAHSCLLLTVRVGEHNFNYYYYLRAQMCPSVIWDYFWSRCSPNATNDMNNNKGNQSQFIPRYTATSILGYKGWHLKISPL